ncbi:MAG: RNA polymerase sigma factor (sigma-70 family) [Planctomycetota bacterium]|jgi:RNA polymerase sigma factor (sigma-70 family)
MLHVNHTSVDRVALCERLFELWEQTGSPALEALAHGRSPCPGASVDTAQQFIDWVSTSLMDCFKDSGNSAAFALLFELNRASFLYAIQGNLRRSYHHVDPQDVLQEVFLNIYRYPHRFLADKSDAFRGWGHRIARNTLLKFLKGQTRLSRFQAIDDETMQPEDLRTRRPDRAASDAESASVVNRAYLMYLQLYMLHFTRLSTKERRALTMVEVDGRSYRDAAADLGIRLENLKMVIFRGRRKVFRGMERSLAELAPQSEMAVNSAVTTCSTTNATAATGSTAATGTTAHGKSVRHSASDRRVLARNCNSAKRMCDQHTQGI